MGTSDIMDANALAHARDLVDVYSNSWGPGSSIASRLRHMTELALEAGANKVSVMFHI